MDKLQLVTCKP